MVEVTDPGLSDVDPFERDIQNSKALIDSLYFNKADEMVTAYDNELSSLVEKHALKRTITVRPTCSLYNEDLHGAKHVPRKFERKWRRAKLKNDHDIYRIQCKQNVKTSPSKRIVSSWSKTNLFKIPKHLLEGPNEGVLPVGKLSAYLAQDFSDFFINKNETIRNDITSSSKSNVNYVLFRCDANSSIECQHGETR